MTVWGFLAGFLIGIFPLALLLKLFTGKVFFIENSYVKGALFGFFLWVLINLALYLEMKYSAIGLLSTEAGFGTIAVFTSSLQGFITAGLAAAFISKRFGRKKPPAG